MQPRTTSFVFAALVTAAVLAPAAGAAAHPGLRPNELRPGETIESELIVPHGCGTEGGMPQDGEVASATVEVAAEWPDGIEIRPVEVDGWTVGVDGDVATWADAGAATTDAILLPVTLSAAVDVAGDILVPVFQACENGESFRWVAAPGEDGDPGIALTVAGELVPAATVGATTAPTPAPVAQATPSPTATPTPSPTPSASPSPSETVTPSSADVDQGGGGVATPWAVGGLLIGAAIASFIVWRRRAGAGTSQ